MQHTMKKIAILALALLFVPFAATAQKYKLLWKENFRGSRIPDFINAPPKSIFPIF